MVGVAERPGESSSFKYAGGFIAASGGNRGCTVVGGAFHKGGGKAMFTMDLMIELEFLRLAA